MSTAKEDAIVYSVVARRSTPLSEYATPEANEGMRVATRHILESAQGPAGTKTSFAGERYPLPSLLSIYLPIAP